MDGFPGDPWHSWGHLAQLWAQIWLIFHAWKIENIIKNNGLATLCLVVWLSTPQYWRRLEAI